MAKKKKSGIDEDIQRHIRKEIDKEDHREGYD